MPMPAGKRDKRIRIERATMGDDGLAKTLSWSTLCDRWAEKLDVSDRERMAAAEVGAEVTTRFRVLRDSVTATITAKDRIVYPIPATGRPQLVFDIGGVKDVDGGNVGIELTAAARTDLEAE